MGASWADHKSKKIVILKCCHLLFHTTTQTISHSDCYIWWEVDFIHCDSQLHGWTEKSKAHSKGKLACIRGRGHCRCLLLVWFTQLSESQLNHYIREVYSTNQWDALKIGMPAVNISQQKRPIYSQQWPMLQKLNKWGYNLPHLQYSSILTTSVSRKSFPRIQWMLKHRCLCFTNKLISCWQKWVD